MYKEQGRDEFLRKRAARQKRQRQRRLIILLICLIVFLLILGVVLSLTIFFPIKNIAVSGSTMYSAGQIIDASGIEKGDNLILLTESSTLEKLKTKLPYIESLQIEKELNGNIKLIVKEAAEYSVVVSGNKYFTVSRSGWVLAERDSIAKNTFEVRGPETECKVGSDIVYKNPKEQELIKEIINALKQEKLNIDYIDISDSLNLKIGVEKRFDVLLGSSNNIEEKVKHLRGMVSKIAAEKEGKINLSMWSPDNLSATFVEKVEE